MKKKTAFAASNSCCAVTLLCVALLACSAPPLIAQKEAKKWDVSAPEGLPLQEVSFVVSEGTWMNVDVSPDGRTLVFDLLGDIYTLPIAGGEARCLRAGLAWEVQPRFSPDGRQVLFTSDAGGGDNIWVMNADGSGARQVTKETFRLLNNPAWMPDGQYFVARKHFTSTRSLGAGEIWLYHLSGGEGVQLTKRKNDQQDVNEPSVSPDGRYVYFSEDLYEGGYFQYNKNPLKQIFAVRRYDRQTGKVETVTGGSGGACRPQISPDGQWLAFVRRVDAKSVLFLRELSSGKEYPLYDQLDKDQQEAWTIFGVYPGFAWMPISPGSAARSLVLWAGGKIRRLDFDVERLSDRKPATVRDIPFRCTVNTRVAETVRFKNLVFEPEFTARAIRHAITSPDGRTLVFNAAGKLYRKELPDGVPEPLVKGPYGRCLFIDAEADNLEMLEFEPDFSPDGQRVLFVTWNDVYGGALWQVRLADGRPQQIPVRGGIFRTPRYSPDGKRVVFRFQQGDDELGISKVEKPRIYYVDLDHPNQPRFVTEEGENPRFSHTGERIYVQTGGYLFGPLDKKFISFDLHGQDRRELFKSKYVNQWVPSPDGQWLAFTELHKAYVCAWPPAGQTLDLSADTKAFPVSLISTDAGYSLHWSADGRRVHYTLGDEYFTIDLTERFAFLPGAPDSLPPLPSTGKKIGLKLRADYPEGLIVFENARIITMEGDRVIENGILVVENNRIAFVGTAAELRQNSSLMAKWRAPGTRRIDCRGKTILPGFVDVHAHSGNFRYGLNPQKQWEYYANLAYGVTTMHDPSVNSEMAFSNAEMLRTGRMVGPRLYSTGTILYGADGDFKAPISSLDDARSALRRTQAWGAFSVKSYNQPRRDQRQQVMAAARELGMIVVPEGGSFFFHNLSQVVDGHTGVEHNLPVAPIYDDVLQLWRRTQAHNTPTLIVCYGAVNGEYYFYQKEDIWKKERLLRFTPRHILNERARHRTMIPDEEYDNGHILVSRQLKKMLDAGIRINLGSHGQLQGLGAHWELWMLAQGGMTPMEALRCATLHGAQYIGMEREIGSLAPGKLADLIVLDKNPLENIRHTEAIRYVMVNGRLYDAETLDEIAPTPRKREPFWFELPGSDLNGAGMLHTCHEAKCVCGH